MVMLIHKSAGILLFIVHSLFLFRSVRLIRSGSLPAKADRLFMNLSQIFLPLVLMSGFFMISRVAPYHMIFGILPVILMFILSRKSVRKKRPLLLPFLNWICITGAFLTGILK